MIRNLLCVILMSPLALAAQDTGGDAADLERLVTSYEQAVRGGDVSKSGIRKSLTDDFSAALPSGQLVKNYGELSKAENALRTLVGRGTVYGHVKATLGAPPMISGDLAVVSGQTANQATAQAGKSRSFTTYWTAVARREGGQWRLARHQAVMDPANNPWHSEESSGGPGWLGLVLTALVAGGVGMAIGFGLAKLAGHPGARVSAAPRPGAPGKPRAWDASPTSTDADAAPDPSAPAPPSSPPPASPRKRAWEK